MAISLAPVTQVLLQDDFNAQLNPTVWSFNQFVPPSGNNSSFNGRTQMEQFLPVVSNGTLQLTVQTFNPTGFSFLGSEIISNQTFSDNSGGIAFTAVARAVSVMPGLVGGIFAYNFNNSTGLHDEIDFETLTNIAASQNNQEQTNVYSNEPLGAGHPQFVNDMDLSAYHTYTMEWFPTAVLWFIDGQLVRESTDHVPQGPLAFHLNFYAPAMDWQAAFSAGLQPTNNQQNNVTYTFQVDSATVSVIGPSTIVASPGVFTLTLAAAPVVVGRMGSEWTAFGTADLSGGGKGDIVWGNGSGQIADWSMNGGTIASLAVDNGRMGAEWKAVGTGDVNGDGRADILWQSNGTLAVWLMNGTNVSTASVVPGHIGAEWKVAATADVNGDGRADVIWTNSGGQVAVWEMSGTQLSAVGVSAGQMGAEWHIAGTGDFNGDGRADLLWANNNGQVEEWTMNGTTLTSFAAADGKNGAEWHVAGVADFNGDQISDIVWENTSGKVDIWFMGGSHVVRDVLLPGQIGAEWHFAGVRDLAGDGTPDIIWANDSGQISTWLLSNVGDVVTGGTGRETYVFNKIAEAGMEITDFLPGAGGGALNLHGLLGGIGYTGADPLNDGELRLVQNASNTEVQFDARPGTHSYLTLATLDNVAATSMTSSNWRF